MKNLKYFSLLIAMHVASVIVASVLVFTVNIAIDSSVFLELLMCIFRYATEIFIIYITYTKWSEKCSKFVFPLSFLLLPIILWILLIIFYPVLGYISDSVGWMTLIVFDAVIVSLPFTVITFIINKKQEEK